MLETLLKQNETIIMGKYQVDFLQINYVSYIMSHLEYWMCVEDQSFFTSCHIFY